jgi:hypothetical protein
MRKFLCRSVLPMMLTLVASTGVANAADWHMALEKLDATTARVSWDSPHAVKYTVCWKRDDAPGDVCGPGHQFMVTAIRQVEAYDSKAGRMTAVIDSLGQCGVKYKVRIKRAALTFDTAVFLMPC